MEEKVTEGDMREHLPDVGVATVYLFACYTIYLLLKKYIK